MNLIRDISTRELTEAQRVADLKAEKDGQMRKYMRKEQSKRDRAKSYIEEEDSFMRKNVVDKLEEFEDKHKYS